MDRMRSIHTPAHSRGFLPQAVDSGDRSVESARAAAALPVKLLMVTGQPALSRDPRTHLYNNLFKILLYGKKEGVLE